ncbi:hypothetical protein [Deinococcus hopiensis]|uniref:hypothetical protein n=1 Tax=Deinococcus hopiensis TaxID=309885 RepID=UPI000A04A824|nr:hypothetical protein [Deinococcus hopiensis]
MQRLSPDGGPPRSQLTRAQRTGRWLYELAEFLTVPVTLVGTVVVGTGDALPLWLPVSLRGHGPRGSAGADPQALSQGHGR